MKIVTIATIAAVGFAAPVLAADLPVNPSYPAAGAVFSWTGCYIGAHVGGAVSEDKTTNIFGHSIDFSSAGFLGGGQLGCDYQFSSKWIVGMEGRAAATSLKNSHPATATNLASLVTVPAQFTLSNEFLASATARVGYSFTDRWLVFVRGGGAWTHEKVNQAYTFAGGPINDPSATLSRTGWTVGTGVEWAFAPDWSATLEYNYYDFGTTVATLTDTSTRVTLRGLSVEDSVHAVTVGLNRRF